jgi:hypothetical protein
LIDQAQFRFIVVRPALQMLNLWSPAAENLLIGTALAESRLTYLRQKPDGPALGLYQMEPATHDDLWDSWLNARPEYARLVRHHLGSRYTSPDRAQVLTWDMRYASMMCRLQYRRFPQALPPAHDMRALGEYWKRYWNTHLGAGRVDKFVELYETHG